MSGVTGDFDEVDHLAEEWDDFARTFPRKLTAALAEESKRLVLAEHQDEHGPAGDGWAALSENTKHPDGEPILTGFTGALRDSWVPYSSEDAFGLDNDTPYGRFHQHGTARMPQRQLVPEDDLGEWASGYDATAEETFAEHAPTAGGAEIT